MAKTGEEATTRRRPASGRPGGPSFASQAMRMNLFVLVRVLFQYLERVDKPALVLAKEVLKDCERKHSSKDSKYATLADAIGERVRDAVGEAHWDQARRIQKQLAANQQKKRLQAMQRARQRSGPQSSSPSSQEAPGEQHRPLQQERANDEALEAARTMSAMSQQVSAGSSTSSLFSAPKCAERQMGDGSTGVPAQIPNLGVQPSRTVTSNDAESVPQQGSGGAAGPALADRHLPFRKRTAFAAVPSSSPSPADSSSSTNPSTSYK